MFIDNFVRVSRGVLIDPVLRVTMQAGRFDLGTSEQVVQLLYDPEIRPDRLTQPLTSDQQRMRRMLGAQGDATTAFESPRARHLFDFIFLLSRDRGVSELRLGTDADHLPTIYHLLGKLGPPDVAADPQGFLRYVLSAVLRLETWDEWTGGPDATRLTLLVRAEVYRALVGPHTGAVDATGYVVIHSRDVTGGGAQPVPQMISEPLELRLATDAGRRAFDREMAQKIRVGHFDAADTFLRERLAGLRGRIADAARASTADSVRIDGWDLVSRECARRLAAGVPISAIGLNLSNYNDSSTSVWHDKEPAIEFAVYGNDAFDFYNATIEEILRACETPPTPWQGLMIGPHPPIVPELSGLRSLNSTLLEYENSAPWRPSYSDATEIAAPEEYVAFALGQWTLHLRFHQAVARHMKEEGLPVSVPVLVGEHDVLPFIRSVAPPGKWIDLRSKDEIRRVLNKDEPSDPTCDAYVAELDAMRRTIQSLGFFSRRRRHALIEQSEARESQLLQSVGGLAWPRRTWTMSDTQFAAFAYAFRIAYQLPSEPTKAEGGS